MPELQEKSELEIVDRGPDWLFVKIRPEEHRLEDVAERLWALLEKHFIYRLVLEMDEVDFLPSLLMGQLVMLHKRVLQHDGALRLCGLSHSCAQALHFCRLDQALPNFETREDAVRGCTLAKPR
ncbi:MAG: STAS domain-containing protein [Planctomycetes bacterium]|nr:STAS domain-containing protein [Planctomycetota bacterium]